MQPDSIILQVLPVAVARPTAEPALRRSGGTNGCLRVTLSPRRAAWRIERETARHGFSSRPFQGTVDGTRFQLRRRKLFCPALQMHGAITPTADGSEIVLTVREHPLLALRNVLALVLMVPAMLVTLGAGLVLAADRPWLLPLALAAAFVPLILMSGACLVRKIRHRRAAREWVAEVEELFADVRVGQR